MEIVVHCDGGSRGNPGQAAWGCILEIRNPTCPPKPCPSGRRARRRRESEIRKTELSGYLGVTTNNQAEYQAVINGLGWIKKNVKVQSSNVKFYLDSELVVEQLNGRYKIKNEGLRPLYWQVRDLVVELGGGIVFNYLPRSKNKRADSLVNKVLDNHRKDTEEH